MNTLAKIRSVFEKDGIAIFPLAISNHSSNHPYPDANYLVKHSKRMGNKWMESDHYEVNGKQLETESDVINYFTNEIKVVEKIIALATISKMEVREYLEEINGSTKVINAPDEDDTNFMELTNDGIRQKLSIMDMDSPKYYPEFWVPILAALKHSIKVLEENNFGI